MVFYQVMGWLVFWISLVLAVILFGKYKKLYPVFYLLSVALYIYTAGYIIDIFSLGKLGILAILVVSAGIFMILGYYLSTVLKEDMPLTSSRK